MKDSRFRRSLGAPLSLWRILVDSANYNGDSGDVIGTAREQVRAWRKARELSQEAFGAMVGASQAMISAIEDGSRVPGLTIALLIQTVTGVPATVWPKKGRAA